jgi:hypothetical protein
MDLTPLIAENPPTLEALVTAHLDRLRDDITRRIRTFA